MAGADTEQEEIIHLPEEISKRSSDAVLSSGSKGNIEPHPFGQPNKNLSLAKEVVESIEVLRDRGRPVNILVIGPAGVGKSTLVNAMFGKDVAKVGVDVSFVASKINYYEGEYKSVRINIYDTPGFRDTGGNSDHSILMDIAKSGKIDLILICLQLGGRVDRDMFLEMASVLHKDMWKRIVVVLTQANRLRTLGSVNPENLSDEITRLQDEYKTCIDEFLSKSVDMGVLEKIPYCIAGKDTNEKLPTTDDWWKTLWETCIDHCSDETRLFLSFYARNRLLIMGIALTVATIGVGIGVGIGAGTGADVGAKVGAAIGTFVLPGAGTVVGGLVGGIVGGAFGVAVASKKS